MPFCPNCGQENDGTIRFCSSCGQALAVAQPTVPAPSYAPAIAGKPEDKLEGYWYVIIWCSLVVPFIGGSIIVVLSSVMYYVWRKDHPRKAKAINLQGWLAFFAGILVSVPFVLMQMRTRDDLRPSSAGQLLVPPSLPQVREQMQAQDVIDKLEQEIELARQRRSRVEVMTIASAVLTFAVDAQHYPDSGGQIVKVSWLAQARDPATKTSLVPDDIQTLPVSDGWGNSYYYVGNKAHFLVFSYGADGKPDKETPSIIKAWMNGAQLPSGFDMHTHCIESDIIWGDGSFLKAPEGEQKRCE
jgi:hypothetical protein